MLHRAVTMSTFVDVVLHGSCVNFALIEVTRPVFNDHWILAVLLRCPYNFGLYSISF